MCRCVDVYMCICVYVFMCLFVYICVNVYMCTCVYVCMCACVRVYVCTWVHGYMGTWVHVYMCTCAHVYMCICVCVYLCICVTVYMCICVFTYIPKKHGWHLRWDNAFENVLNLWSHALAFFLWLLTNTFRCQYLHEWNLFFFGYLCMFQTSQKHTWYGHNSDLVVSSRVFCQTKW